MLAGGTEVGIDGIVLPEVTDATTGAGEYDIVWTETTGAVEERSETGVGAAVGEGDVTTIGGADTEAKVVWLLFVVE